jgi:hypothetical protein
MRVIPHSGRVLSLATPAIIFIRKPIITCSRSASQVKSSQHEARQVHVL